MMTSYFLFIFCSRTALTDATMLAISPQHPNVGHRSVHDPHHPKYVEDGNEVHDSTLTPSKTVSTSGLMCQLHA